MNNVLDFAIESGLHPVKTANTRGGEYSCACPCCGGHDRFRIWPFQNDGDGSFWCRQCGIHGDRIQFVRETRHVGLAEAVRITGDEAKFENLKRFSRRGGFMQEPIVPGMQPEHRSWPDKIVREAPPVIVDTALWAEKVGKMVEYAAGRLSGSPGERILSEKGITLPFAQKHHLGWLAEDIYRLRSVWGLSDILNEHGVPKKLWLPAGVTIPMFRDSEVKRVRVRRSATDIRYYVVPGSDMAPMVLGNMADVVMIVESELDAILVAQEMGDSTGVVAMGSAAAKPDAGLDRILRDAKRLLISLDADAVGDSCAKYWLETYRNACRWPVPEGKDPSDALQKGVNIRQWVLDGWPKGIRMVMGSAQIGVKRGSNPVKPGQNGHEMAGQCAETSQKSEQKAENTAQNGVFNADGAGFSSEFTQMSSFDKLGVILRRNPAIRIHVDRYHMGIDVPPAWRMRNDRIFRMLSDLVFMDAEIFDYLLSHGSNVINSGNFGCIQAQYHRTRE